MMNPFRNILKEKMGNDDNYLENTTQELVSIIKQHYFMIACFIPSTVYKTSLIDTEVLINGSNFISHSYPHFALVSKALNENLLTYKTQNDVVFLRENPDDAEVDSKIKWFSRYLGCIPSINNKQHHYYAEKIGGHDLYYEIPALIIYAKARDDPNLKNSVFEIIKTMYQLRSLGLGLLYQIYIMIFYFTPKKICKYYVKKVEVN